jgi:hypothetical protein
VSTSFLLLVIRMIANSSSNIMKVFWDT